MLTYDQAERLTDRGVPGSGPQFFMVWMPYLYQRVIVQGKKHAFLPLNRDYKPLGYPRSDWVDYDKAALTHGVVFARDPATFEGIWHNTRDDMFWLYDDDPETRRDYFMRLERLMQRSMPLVAKRD